MFTCILKKSFNELFVYTCSFRDFSLLLCAELTIFILLILLLSCVNVFFKRALMSFLYIHGALVSFHSS